MLHTRWYITILAAATVTLVTTPRTKAVAIPAPVTQNEQEDELKVYDLRDLVALLPKPPAPAAPSVPILTDVPIVGNLFRNEGQAEPAPKPADQINLIAAAAGLSLQPMGENIYLGVGSTDRHHAFEQVLPQLRKIESESFDVELTVAKTDAATSPPLGSAFDASGPVVRIHRTVNARETVALSAVRSESYVAGWVPVVANDAVGYQSQNGVVRSGLESTLVLRTNGPSADIELDGSLTRSTISYTSPELSTGKQDPPAKLSIGLPRVDERLLGARTRVPFGRSVVLAVVSGFEEGSNLVVSIKVSKIPDLEQ